MRSQDIIIIFLLLLWGNSHRGRMAWLKEKTGLSRHEIYNCLKRLKQSKLISQDTEKVIVNNLKEFLSYGLKYVYPLKVERKNVVKGMVTVYEGPLAKQMVLNGEPFVWPNPNSKSKGLAVVPLHKMCIPLSENDLKMYHIFCLLDGARSWLPRESKLCLEYLTNVIDKYSS